MCQFCVDEGRMTQTELDQRVAAGDKSVVSLLDLPAVDAIRQISQMTASDIQDGADVGESLAAMVEIIGLYVRGRIRAGKPISDAETAEIEKAAHSLAVIQNARMVAPWN